MTLIRIWMSTCRKVAQHTTHTTSSAHNTNTRTGHMLTQRSADSDTAEQTDDRQGQTKTDTEKHRERVERNGRAHSATDTHGDTHRETQGRQRDRQRDRGKEKKTKRKSKVMDDTLTGHTTHDRKSLRAPGTSGHHNVSRKKQEVSGVHSARLCVKCQHFTPGHVKSRS